VWKLWRNVEGRLTHSYIDPATYELVLLLRRWYAEGLLDSEFATQSINKLWERTGRGEIGSLIAPAIYSGRYDAMNRPSNNMVPEKELGNERAEVVIIPPLVGPRGDEGFIYTQFGKSGVHFDWSGEIWESQPIVRKTGDVPDGYSEQGGLSSYPPFYTHDRFKYVIPGHQIRFYEEYLMAPRGQAHSLRPNRWDLRLETQEHKLRGIYGATIRTMFQEFFFKSIIGEIDPEREWDSYVQKMLGSGLREIQFEIEEPSAVP
jgi:putative aldouronate transport system substrate-binding protein